LLQEILEARNGIAVMEPTVDWLRADGSPPDLTGDPHARADLHFHELRGSLGEDEQQTLAFLGSTRERSSGLDLIVEAEHGWSPSGAHDPTQRFETLTHAGKGDRLLLRRRRKRMNRVRQLRQYPRRSFGTEEEVAEILASGGARHGARPYDLAVREHRFEGDQHVLDVPVLGRELTRGTRRDPATHRRKRDRLREMPHRVARLIECRLELRPEESRRDRRQQRDVVDVLQRTHRAEVDDERAFRSEDRSTHTRARPEGYDADALSRRIFQDGADFGGISRTDHAGGRWDRGIL
jgi:hypothetical protein